MPYLPAHTFEPYQDDDPGERLYCGLPREDGICAKRADHSIHNTLQPAIEKVARYLATRKWKDEPGDWSVHSKHNYSTDCALCTQDVHAIAKAVLDFVGPPAGRNAR